MLKILSEPQLRAPILLCGVAGWSDAASAASSAVTYLLNKRESQPIARFDSDRLYCYTITRPTTRIGPRRGRIIRWPDFSFHAVAVPEAERDLVILAGPEPDLNWRAMADAAAEFAERIGVKHLITLGCFYAPIHYARPPLAIGASSDENIERRLRSLGAQESQYEGPTGVLSAIAFALGQREIITTSLWTAAPSYLPNLENPKLAAFLLGMVEKLIDQELWLMELRAAGNDLEQRIREAIRQRPDLARTLEGMDPNAPEEPAELEITSPSEPLPPPGELPSKEDVLNEVEEYLRKLRGQPPDEPRAP